MAVWWCPPSSLRLFLTAVAIADDLGAIIIIAVFYTADLTLPMLVLAGIGPLLLCLLNLFRVRTMSVYAFVGTLIWFFMLKSGVHATLAGVAVLTGLGFTMSLFIGSVAGASFHRHPRCTGQAATRRPC